MTPQAPEWRRNRADAIIDGDAAVETMGWKGYRIEPTHFDIWAGQREKWFKAVRKYRISGPQQQVQETPHDTD